jgi:predicted RNase H-like nuclease (RuvC/YqgF family)
MAHNFENQLMKSEATRQPLQKENNELKAAIAEKDRELARLQEYMGLMNTEHQKASNEILSLKH